MVGESVVYDSVVRGQGNETDWIWNRRLLLDDHYCFTGCHDDDYRRRLTRYLGRSALRGNWRYSSSLFSSRSMLLPLMDAVQHREGSLRLLLMNS